MKLESAVRGFRSTCIRYTCVGTCVISLIAAAVVKLTWPDVRDGYVEECGNVDVFGLVSPSFLPAVVGGEVAMVRACGCSRRNLYQVYVLSFFVGVCRIRTRLFFPFFDILPYGYILSMW